MKARVKITDTYRYQSIVAAVDLGSLKPAANGCWRGWMSIITHDGDVSHYNNEFSAASFEAEYGFQIVGDVENMPGT